MGGRPMTVHSQPVPFDAFMSDALYGEAGFYTRGGRAGRRGDFLTSPEVGPLFGAVVARFLDHEWGRLGRPDPFVVVDAGAGPGALLRSVLAAAPECSGAMRLVAVDVSDAQRAQHPEGVESRGELPDGPIDGVIIANELLDNLPFRLAVHDGGWREAYVVRLPDGRLAETLSAVFDPLPAVLPASADGNGFDVGSAGGAGGMGLPGMRERATVAGGVFRMRSVPGRGTCVAVEIAP